MTSISHRYLAAAAGAVLLGLCQSASAQAQPPKADCALPATSDPTLPPLTAICGLDGPEDIAPLPDQRHLVISNLTFSGTAPKSAELHLLDTATDTVSRLRRSYAPGPIWGDPQCVAAQGFSSHGIDIRRRADSKQQLLVVNHAEREAIDFFELTEDNAGPLAAWRGCVTGAGCCCAKPAAHGAVACIWDWSLPMRPIVQSRSRSASHCRRGSIRWTWRNCPTGTC